MAFWHFAASLSLPTSPLNWTRIHNSNLLFHVDAAAGFCGYACEAMPYIILILAYFGLGSHVQHKRMMWGIVSASLAQSIISAFVAVWSAAVA